MPAYQLLYPPYSELYGDPRLSWSLLVGNLILAIVDKRPARWVRMLKSITVIDVLK
jgi:hypothetical protein